MDEGEPERLDLLVSNFNPSKKPSKKYSNKYSGKPLPPTIKDYRLKPLKNFQRPYFSSRIGSYEIDYAEARSGGQSRWYFVSININTKYLMMYSLDEKPRIG
jgi:hypothetical protein